MMLNKRISRNLVVALSALALASACSHAKSDTRPASSDEYTLVDLNEQLVMATLWVQTSSEYRALCYQAYNTAKMMLDKDLAEVKTDKKRIIVVDGDETTIQANEYEAHVIGENVEYPTRWYDWVASASGPAIPGGVEFLNYAASKGVETYYVTNRKIDLEYQGTLDNLKKLGYPNVDPEHIVYRQKGQSDDKQPRQLALEEKFHVVLYVGDNNDDYPANYFHKSIDERFQITDSIKDLWGTKYIALPNPMYGAWEKAIKNYERNMSAADQNKARKKVLRRWMPQTPAQPAAAK